jgi:hypothetical protein
MVLDINKILDSFEQECYDNTPEDFSPSPCYQAKFESGNVTFLIDGKDVATYPVGTRSLRYQDVKPTLCQCFDLLKENNIKELKRAWKK